MFVKSDLRIQLENEIGSSHDDAQREALKWCLKHPIKGARAFISMVTKGDVSDDVAKAWQDLPSWHNYQSAYDALVALERVEGFPAMGYLSQQLDTLKSFLPNSTKAYYPFAGTDFYWARIFDEISFEDVGYDKEYVKNMWWRPRSYQAESIDGILATMQEAGVLRPVTFLHRISGDANIAREDNDFNRTDWTLIVKGGHSVVNFLEKRFPMGVDFGSVVIVGPADRGEELRQGMDERKYDCVHYDPGESYYAPFTMGMRHQYVFRKK